MREASTKPSAATVLPAPVACSNQKRLAALGSSGCSRELLLVLGDLELVLLVPVGERRLRLGAVELGLELGGDVLLLVVLVVLVVGGRAREVLVVVVLVVERGLLVLVVVLLELGLLGGRGGLVVGVVLVFLDAQDRGAGEHVDGAVAVAVPSMRSASASSAVSVPDSASTWCADSVVPSASFGSSSESTRSSPSSSE